MDAGTAVDGIYQNVGVELLDVEHDTRYHGGGFQPSFLDTFHKRDTYLR